MFFFILDKSNLRIPYFSFSYSKLLRCSKQQKQQKQQRSESPVWKFGQPKKFWPRRVSIFRFFGLLLSAATLQQTAATIPQTYPICLFHILSHIYV
jgi:hypothetical protein